MLCFHPGEFCTVVKLGGCDGAPITPLKAQMAHVLFDLFSGQMFSHQVSGVGGTLDLDELHCVSQVLLL